MQRMPEAISTSSRLAVAAAEITLVEIGEGRGQVTRHMSGFFNIHFSYTHRLSY